MPYMHAHMQGMYMRIAVGESKQWKSILTCTVWLVGYKSIRLTSNTKMDFHVLILQKHLSRNQNNKSPFSCGTY